MLNEEEKKAIEWFKSDLEMTKEMGKRWGFQEEIKNNEIILNLVEKQQKEIEELKTDKKDNIQVIYGGRRCGTEEMVVKDYISKDKIRKLLKKYDKDIAWANADDHYYFIKYINELLEEK